MLDFNVLTNKETAVPSTEPSNENFQEGGELEDLIVSQSGKLVPVERLNDDDDNASDISLENLDVPDLDPSTEVSREETMFKASSTGVKKALDRLQKATGLNFDQPQPKPPPSIMIEKGVCRVYLQGACYLTLAPLVHLLTAATANDKFAIEVDSPYLSSSDFITLASAIEHSKANVQVAARRITSMYIFMVLDVADEIHIAPNVHHVGSMSTFAMGSSLDVQNTSEAFASHERYAQEIFVEKGFLTEDQLEEITEKAKSVRFTTEELLSRLNR